MGGARIGALAAMSAASAGAVNAATAERASTNFFMSIPQELCARTRPRDGVQMHRFPTQCENYNRFHSECCCRESTLVGKRSLSRDRNAEGARQPSQIRCREGTGLCPLNV